MTLTVCASRSDCDLRYLCAHGGVEPVVPPCNFIMHGTPGNPLRCPAFKWEGPLADLLAVLE